MGNWPGWYAASAVDSTWARAPPVRRAWPRRPRAPRAGFARHRPQSCRPGTARLATSSLRPSRLAAGVRPSASAAPHCNVIAACLLPRLGADDAQNAAALRAASRVRFGGCWPRARGAWLNLRVWQTSANVGVGGGVLGLARSPVRHCVANRRARRLRQRRAQLASARAR